MLGGGENDSFAVRNHGARLGDVAAHLGIRPGLGARSATLIAAAGYKPFHDAYPRHGLGAPDLLVGRRRAEIIRQADEIRARFTRIG